MPPTGQYNVFELSTGSVVGISTATTISASTASITYVAPYTPTTANIVGGYANNAVGASTLVTIPASRTWVGSLAVQAVLATAPGSAAVTGKALILLPNGTGVPSGVELLAVTAATPLSTSTSGSGTTSVVANQMANVTITAGTSATTIQGLSSSSPTAWNVSAYGTLL